MSATFTRKEVIGDCTLYLGDCIQILPELGGVDLVLTDPPYEEEAHGAMRRTRRSVEGRGIDELGFDALSESQRVFLPAWAGRNCAGWMLAFCQVEAAQLWRDAMVAGGTKYKRTMVWVKPDSSPQFNGTMPAQGYECISLGWCGAGASRWNGGGKRGVFVYNTRQPDRHGAHKTEKPLPLITDLLNLFSNLGDRVIDPFMGSGTTGVSCVKNGRRFVGVEIHEPYFEIACERIRAAYAQADMFVAPPSNPLIAKPATGDLLTFHQSGPDGSQARPGRSAREDKNTIEKGTCHGN